MGNAMESPEGADDGSGFTGAENRAAPKSQIGYYSILTSNSTDGRVMVGPDIEIFPDKPRPEFANGEMQAYEAKDRRAMGAQVALLCRNSRVPRVTSIGSYKSIKSNNIMRLVDAGIIDWNPEGRQKLALVFDMPMGRKMLEGPDAKPIRISEDKIIETLIQPVLNVLQEFRMAGMVHGDLSLENMYLTGTEQVETVVVGECLSTAQFFSLSALYVTIERGLAQPSGRGTGGMKDDIYALGMCVVQALRGVNLAKRLTTEEIVAQKLEKGSYSFAIGGERLPGGLGDFLRGTLNDDESQRWDLDEAIKWAEGRRNTTKQQHVVSKAARPFVFREKKYWDLRTIAAAFARHPADAGKALEKDHFVQWIRRNFEDKDLETRLEKVWGRERGGGRERLVSSVCTALDPEGPVRYKELAIFPSGYGVALAAAVSRQDDIQPYAELVSMQMFTNWIQQRFDELPDATGMITTFEKCRNFLVQKMPVYGIERVLYMLDKEVVCMSPLLHKYVVLGPGSLLLVLEDISRRADRPEHILDRHMMAFISVREPKMIDPYLGHVISHDKGYQIVGITRTLASIQRRFNTGPVPGVGAWIISMIQPAIDRFNDRDLRAEVTRRMNKLSATGNLTEILELIDDNAQVQDDIQRFTLARREYAGLMNERRQIDTQLHRRAHFGRATGRQIAMLSSAMLSALCIVGYLFLRLVGV